MTQALYIAAAFAIGIGNATQLVMLTALARSRGSVEGAFTSLVTTVLGFGVVLAILAWRQGSLAMPAPYDRWPVFLALVLVFTAGTVFIMRGLNGYFVVTGLFALPLLIGTGFLGPRIGIGMFIAAVLAGQLSGAVVYDHIGAFGAEVRRVDGLRALGVLALLSGVVLIRGVR
jgi:uncharacterized membrane protein YdcZ (DUF606 family)